jgi:hypothetical protein
MPDVNAALSTLLLIESIDADGFGNKTQRKLAILVGREMAVAQAAREAAVAELTPCLDAGLWAAKQEQDRILAAHDGPPQ